MHDTPEITTCDRKAVDDMGDTDLVYRVTSKVYNRPETSQRTTGLASEKSKWWFQEADVKRLWWCDSLYEDVVLIITQTST